MPNFSRNRFSNSQKAVNTSKEQYIVLQNKINEVLAEVSTHRNSAISLVSFVPVKICY